MLITLTPPTQEPFSVADAKAFLRVFNDDDDELIAGLIRAARVKMENYLHRALMTQTVRYTRDSFPGFHPLWMRQGYPEFYLPKPPLQHITKFQYIDVDGVVQDFADYQLSSGGDNLPARLLSPYARPWPPTRMVPDNVIVEYVCGYEDGKIPETIMVGMKQLIADWYENREPQPLTGTEDDVMPKRIARLVAEDRCLLV